MKQPHTLHALLPAIATLALLLSPAAAPQELLEEVLITGEQPGPAMWRVSKDDHTLWIVGTVTPLPTKMSWRSKQVEDVVHQSGEILANSSTSATVKGSMLFTALRLLPAIMRLRNNADGTTLQQALPEDVYARWAAAYRLYVGKAPDKDEKWRPMMAAGFLQQRALERSGLSDRAVVWPMIASLAKKNSVKIRRRTFPISLEDPKGLIAEIAAIPRAAEIACLIATMDHIDRDLPNIRARAEAWAIGDVKTLRSLPLADEAGKTCSEAFFTSPRLRKMMEEQRPALEEDWLGAAGYMLLEHETSLTTLSMAELLGENGMLARLRARGYTVEEPDL
jgi:uncharacterized protein YbaP (TraB family)